MTPLEHLAGRVASDPFFLAHQLAGAYGPGWLSNPRIAADLGVDQPQVVRLAMCRAVRTPEDASEIAGRFGASATALLRLAEHQDL